MVQNVHLSGGSLLGVSRGGPNISDIVDSMQVLGSIVCVLIVSYSLFDYNHDFDHVFEIVAAKRN